VRAAPILTRLAARLSLAAGLVVASAGSTTAWAADVTLLCAGAMKPAVSAILARRGDASPHVAASYATAGAIRDRMASGDLSDVVIAPSDAMDAFAAGKLVDAATRRPLGETEIGIAVRKGAPKPDVSTPDALRAALIAAHRIVIVDPSRGTSGRLLEVIFRDLGVGDVVAAKLMRIDGGMVTEAVARGEADLGFQQVSEILPVEGVELIGTLPGTLKRLTRYDVAQTTRSAQRPDGAALVDALTSADALAAIRASGFSAPR
jgi:molybdate transport system substrate-binding protein